LLPALLAAAAVSCPATTAYPPPPPDRPRYVLHVRVLPGERRVDGDLRVRFTASRPTDRLVFRLWANGPRSASEGASLAVRDVAVDGRRARMRTPDPTTLVVPLGRRLADGSTVTASLLWSLRVPGPVFDRIAEVDGTLRLGSFFPVLAWDPERGWATDPPAQLPGETSTSPTADFDVSVHVPRGLRVIGSGAQVEPGRWRASVVRDFALAVGRFDIATETADGVRVTVAAPHGMRRLLPTYLSATRDALARLSTRYGPYPWPTFSVAVMPDEGFTGIEYPTLVFVGRAYPQFLVAHETAHQWFYSLVGNDQARDPWLDEALASWAQTSIGWPYPRRPLGNARGLLGEPMTYWDRHQRDYAAGVYAQGVAALRALGEPARVDCALRTYVRRQAYGIARPADLIAALETQFPDARTVLARYGARP
jgi:hypothetical protein